MLTIVHASDLHFGKAFDSRAARGFSEAVRTHSPDLLVLSGDFTQRAKIREYREAREFLAGFSHLPLVVTPGNHDVPLYRVWERVFAPLRNYREYISSELDTVTSIPGATVVSLDSTSPLRAIVNGRLSNRQLLFAARAFEGAPSRDAKIVVFHHPLAPAPDYGSDQVLQGFQHCLDLFERMGVELILGGHFHRAFMANSLDAYPSKGAGRGIPLVYSGTTTSKRGRGRERNKNSFNLIRISGSRLVVSPHLFRHEEGGFGQVGMHVLPWRGDGVLEAESEKAGTASQDPTGRGKKEEK